MKRSVWLLAIWGALAVGCAAIPAAVQKKALPAMPFPELIQQANRHIGETLILGGYVLEVRNLEDETRIVAIQAPLDADLKPQARDLSQGLIILFQNRFLDPKVYVKDSKITVAGELLGSSATKNFHIPYPSVELKLTHIHLWSE